MGKIFANRFVQVFTVVLGLQAALFYTASHGDARPLSHPLSDFPAQLGSWLKIGDGQVDDETRSVLRADDILSRFYARGGAVHPAGVLAPGSVELFIAYFTTQQQGQSPHSPKNCLPGSGWTPLDAGETTVEIPGLAQPLTINKYVIQKGNTESLVLYWYQSHGRVVANEFAAKFFLVADSMRYHRSDTALVRVVTPVFNDDQKGAMDAAVNFVQSAFPAAYRFLPM